MGSREFNGWVLFFKQRSDEQSLAAKGIPPEQWGDILDMIDAEEAKAAEGEGA